MTKLYDSNGQEIEIPKPATDSGGPPLALVVVFVAMISGGFGVLCGRTMTSATPSPTPVVAKVVDAQHSWMIPPAYEAPADMNFASISTDKGTWTLYFTTAEKLESLGCMAYTSMDNRVIYLPTDARLEERQEDLLHEVMHIAEFIGGGPDTRLSSIGPEEEVINSAAPKLLDIMRRNPQLVKWLASGKKDSK